MPIYEYQCTSSGERFEVQQKMSDPPIATCDQLSCTCTIPQPVTKMISAPAIMFKGTGWYVTDYSEKLKEPESKSENKGKPADTPTNGESKPETKTGSPASESGGAGSATSGSSSSPVGSTGSSSSAGAGSSSSSSGSSGAGSSSSSGGSS